MTAKTKLVSALLLSILLSCYTHNPSPIQVTDNIVLQFGNNPDITTYKITVTASDMDTICIHQLANSNSLGISIPPGKDRCIVVDGYDDSGTRRYTWSDTIDIGETETKHVLVGMMPVQVPIAPDGLVLAVLSPETVRVAWNPTVDAEVYTIYRTNDTLTAAIPVATCSVNIYLDVSVVPATTYYYRLTASNYAGESAPSAYRRVITPPIQQYPPAAPQWLAAVGSSVTAVKLAWQVSPNALSYNVYRASSIAAQDSLIASVVDTTYWDTGLTPNTSYFYAVSATNSAGRSAKTARVAGTTQLPIPNIPSGLSASGQSEKTIVVSWNSTAWADCYKVYRTIDAKGSYAFVDSTVDTTFVDTGLAALTTYYYKISAANRSGSSGLSESASAQTLAPPIEKPSPPTNVIATALSSFSIQIQWQHVSGATSYGVYRSTESSGVYAAIALTVTCAYVDTGLTEQTTYFYKVTAFNSAGQSVPSAVASATTPKYLARPSGLVALALSPTSIELDWNSVSGATGYTVYRSLTGTFEAIASPASNTYTDNGLTSGTTYYYCVCTRDAMGRESETSDTVSATTLLSIPDTPTGVTATAVSSSKIEIRFNPVSSADGYNIYWRTEPADTFALLVTTGSTLFTHLNLTAETEYFYQVSAYNGVGESPRSVTVSARTTGPGPDTPPGVTATAKSQSIIQIDYGYVQGANGYNIYWSMSSSGPFELLDTTIFIRYVHDSLSPDTEYFYQVSAYNNTGESPRSSVVSARTPKESADLVAYVDVNRCYRQCPGMCGQACPLDAISYGVVDVDKCDGCGLCVPACSFGAITLVPR